MVNIEIDTALKDIPPQNYSDCKIETVNFCDISYNYFFENFMVRNVPCIVKNICWNWECSNKWTKNNNIDYDYISDTYGNLEAPVADCDNIDFNAHCKCSMKVSDYMNYLRNEERDKTLYLKDWHLRRERPSSKFYHVPFIFGSDWLNEYAEDRQEDDFMFVYIGPSKSWTPFHADVYCSYSWSVNIYGKKKWTLLPPNEEEKLRDPFGNLPLLFDFEKFKNVKYFEIIQDKGDALFVPSGWHHQVTNLLDTISVNHNFINACNIELVWYSLQKNLQCVEKEIQEFKFTPEFQKQCQLILKSVFGMDFVDFLHFITHIAQKRFNQLHSGCHSGFNNFILGIKHIKFDLNILLKIIKSVEDHPLILNKFIAAQEIDTLSNIKRLIVSKLCQ